LMYFVSVRLANTNKQPQGNQQQLKGHAVNHRSIIRLAELILH